MVSATGVYVLSTENKVVGGSGPPAFGGNWSDAPAGHGLEGLVILDGHEPHGADEVVLDESTADRAGYELGDQVSIVTATQTLDVHPTLVGIAGFREGGSLNGATYAAFDTPTAQQLFLDGQDAYNVFWVTAKDGVSQEELTDQASAVLPDGYEAVTGDDAAEESAGPLLERHRLPHHVPADLRRDRAGGEQLHHRQHLLDPGRPAQPRARAAARAGGLQAAGDPLGPARGVRRRRRRLHARPRPRRAAGDGHPRPWSRRSASTWPTSRSSWRRGPSSRRTPPGSSSRWSRPGCPPAGPAGSRRSRRSATTSPCPSRPYAAGCCSASR